MIQDVKRLMDTHWEWLRDNTQVQDVGQEWIEITTPYLDRHNDMLQIYAKRTSGGFLLTDDGYTIRDLIHSGCKLDSLKRQSLLQMTLAGFGVSNKDGQLEVQADEGDFAIKKHSLVQAMLAVNDLFYLANPVIKSIFREDVNDWLDQHDIRITPSVKFTGKSGYDHLFQFVIPKSRVQPERILETITRPSRDTAEAFAFKWIDTKDVRSNEARAYAILNDQDRSISAGVVDALVSYNITPVTWSQRGQIQDELAA